MEQWKAERESLLFQLKEAQESIEKEKAARLRERKANTRRHNRWIKRVNTTRDQDIEKETYELRAKIQDLEEAKQEVKDSLDFQSEILRQVSEELADNKTRLSRCRVLAEQLYAQNMELHASNWYKNQELEVLRQERALTEALDKEYNLVSALPPLAMQKQRVMEELKQKAAAAEEAAAERAAAERAAAEKAAAEKAAAEKAAAERAAAERAAVERAVAEKAAVERAAAERAAAERAAEEKSLSLFSLLRARLKGFWSRLSAACRKMK